MHSSSFSFFATLLMGLLIGAATMSLRSLPPANAQTAPTSSPWQLGIANGETARAAWRLNTAAGFLELCNATGGPPRCVAMPAPNPK